MEDNIPNPKPKPVLPICSNRVDDGFGIFGIFRVIVSGIVNVMFTGPVGVLFVLIGLSIFNKDLDKPKSGKDLNLAIYQSIAILAIPTPAYNAHRGNIP